MVKKAECTLLASKGYSVDDDIDKVIKDYQGDLEKESEVLKDLQSEKHKMEVERHVQEKKSAMKITGMTIDERVEEKFIKRYLFLDSKVKTKEQLLNFIKSLQRAITEKKIRKTSKYAGVIVDIQNNLVSTYNALPEKAEGIKFTLLPKKAEELKALVGDKRVRLSITYNKRFIGLYGKETKDKLQLFNAYNHNLSVTGKMPNSLKGHEIVFFDSVTSMGMELEELEDIQEQYPQNSFVYILQTNKQGNFYGKMKWEHLCDVVLGFEDGVVNVEKNWFTCFAS